MASSGPYARPWNHFLTEEISTNRLPGKVCGQSMGPLESAVLPGGSVHPP